MLVWILKWGGVSVARSRFRCGLGWLGDPRAKSEG